MIFTSWLFYVLSQDRLTGHGGISSIGSGSTGGGSSPFCPHHHRYHNTTPTSSGPGNGGSSAMGTHQQDFQPPYFPPPFSPTHHHQHHQSSTATSPSVMDYLSDPYSQTLNSLQTAQVAAAHYNQLTVAAVSAGQRHDAIWRADTADSKHVVSPSQLIIFTHHFFVFGERAWNDALVLGEVSATWKWIWNQI